MYFIANSKQYQRHINNEQSADLVKIRARWMVDAFTIVQLLHE